MMSEQQNEATQDMTQNIAQHESPEDDQSRLTFKQTLVSVMRASFGVQNRKNKVRDFQRGSPAAFFFAALLFTSVFVAALVTIVVLVLP